MQIITSLTEAHGASQIMEQENPAGHSDSKFLAPFVKDVKKLWPLEKWASVKSLIAVSGGPDSIALARVLAACHQHPSDKLLIAHVNHGTRGIDSDQDQLFVSTVADNLGLEFHCKRVQIEQVQHKPVPEATLREHRYTALKQIALETGARYIATGHNKNDQVETILMRLFRGTGPAGLAGIPFHRSAGDGVTVIRPLLSTSRESIEQLLINLNQPVRSDASNAETFYTRNFLRHEILPRVQKKFGRDVDELIARLAGQVSEQQEFIRSLAVPHEAAIKTADDRIEIDSRLLSDVSPLIIRELVAKAWKKTGWSTAAMTFEHWQAVAGLVSGDAKNAAINLPGNIRLEKSNHIVILAPQS